uniref:Uncharacterized protein n=1 Tax=Rangifer tarandus platyrhynchus TaxID=3082113 RepID=A0ACB0FN67_RANTA|nr:unnamed protein product [Rangifer tarandus platyrhynchus]
MLRVVLRPEWLLPMGTIGPAGGNRAGIFSLLKSEHKANGFDGSRKEHEVGPPGDGPAVRVQAPVPMESEEKQRKPPGSDWAGRGVVESPPREPARVSGHHEERKAVGGAGLDAWSACQKRTNRPALLTEAAGAGPVTTSRATGLDGVSLGLSEGSGSSPSALPCRAPRLPPPTLWPGAGLCLLQALVAVDGPCVDLGGGVLAEL